MPPDRRMAPDRRIPAEGSATPAEGLTILPEGSTTPAEGSAVPAEGSAVPAAIVPPVGWHEIAGLTPVMFLIVAIGIYPRPILEQMRPALARIDEVAQFQRDEAKKQLPVKRLPAGRRTPGSKDKPAETEEGRYRQSGIVVERREEGGNETNQQRPVRLARAGPDDSREAAMTPAISLDVFRQTALVLLPEFILLFAAMAIMTASAFVRRPRRYWWAIAASALLLAFLALLAVMGRADRTVRRRCAQ